MSKSEQAIFSTSTSEVVPESIARVIESSDWSELSEKFYEVTGKAIRFVYVFNSDSLLSPINGKSNDVYKAVDADNEKAQRSIYRKLYETYKDVSDGLNSLVLLKNNTLDSELLEDIHYTQEIVSLNLETVRLLKEKVDSATNFYVIREGDYKRFKRSRKDAGLEAAIDKKLIEEKIASKAYTNYFVNWESDNDGTIAFIGKSERERKDVEKLFEDRSKSSCSVIAEQIAYFKIKTDEVLGQLLTKFKAKGVNYSLQRLLFSSVMK
jgi:hypothetical protein